LKACTGKSVGCVPDPFSPPHARARTTYEKEDRVGNARLLSLINSFKKIDLNEALPKPNVAVSYA